MRVETRTLYTRREFAEKFPDQEFKCGRASVRLKRAYTPAATGLDEVCDGEQWLYLAEKIEGVADAAYIKDLIECLERAKDFIEVDSYQVSI